MTNIEHFHGAAALIEKLKARQALLKVHDKDVTMLTGLSHTTLSSCRNGKSQLTLRTAMAWAAALGLDVVLSERPR